MGNIRIKKRAEIEKKKIQLEIDILKNERFKNKEFTTFSGKEKDALLEQIAKDLGYL